MPSKKGKYRIRDRVVLTFQPGLSAAFRAPCAVSALALVGAEAEVVALALAGVDTGKSLGRDLAAGV